MAKHSNNIIIGLDIGTTKVCTLVGELTNIGEINIIGIGSYPCNGLRKGTVINIDNTITSIKKAIEKAEEVSNCDIRSAFIGIAGPQIKSFNSYGIVAIRNSEVDETDVKRALEAARAIAMPLDREVLHILPQYFIVDDQDGIKDPIGISGVRLEVRTHIITGMVTSIQNILKSVNGVGLEVNEIILEQIAASEAVLSNDEKEIGVSLIDIGGGTTNIAIFLEGGLKYTSVLPVGGNYLTSDISIGLRTPLLEAEKIKIKYGCASASNISNDETIEIPNVGGRNPWKLSRQILGEIIGPRLEEILNLIYKEIVHAGFEKRLAAGVVLTGGTVLIQGINELTEAIFKMPVRTGYPLGIKGFPDIIKNPIYSTAAGLILYGKRYYELNNNYKKKRNNFFGKILSFIKKSYKDLF